MLGIYIFVAIVLSRFCANHDDTTLVSRPVISAIALLVGLTLLE